MTDLPSSFSMSHIRAGFGSAVVIIAIVVGIPLQWLSVKLHLPTARYIPILFHRISLWALGVRVQLRGTCQREGAVLIAANHSSWLDISVLGSLQPLSFIAKSEVSGWPIFGLLAKLQRTVFVNRTRRSETGVVTTEIARRLKSGDAMVLFPEGTSSDGNQVLPFRSALIGAAKAAMTAKSDNEDDGDERPVWIQPLSVAYNGIQGLAMGRQHRHLVAWYGDMDLMPHLWSLMKEGAIDVTVTFGEPIAFDGSINRKTIALRAEQTVRNLMMADLHHRHLDDAMEPD